VTVAKTLLSKNARRWVQHHAVRGNSVAGTETARAPGSPSVGVWPLTQMPFGGTTSCWGARVAHLGGNPQPTIGLAWPTLSYHRLLSSQSAAVPQELGAGARVRCPSGLYFVFCLVVFS
jgi:hypothetical protein